jgi:hypothetical protein
VFENGAMYHEMNLVRYVNQDFINAYTNSQSSTATTGANNLTATGLTQAQYVSAVQALQSQAGTWKANPVNFNATQIAIQTLTQQYNQQFRGQ